MWVSLHNKTKPQTIRNIPLYIRQVYGEKVHVLTRGDLSHCCRLEERLLKEQGFVVIHSWFDRSQQRWVCHEQSMILLWCCLNDEGRPLEVDVQAQASNHLYVAGLKRSGEKR